MKSGMTLLELMIVVMIIGVLTFLAVPRYFKTVERFRAEEGRRMLLSLLAAQKHFFLENDTYATAVNQLDIRFDLNSDNYEMLQDSDVNLTRPLLAQVRRRGSLYTLQINEAGTITCLGSPKDLCPMLASNLNN